MGKYEDYGMLAEKMYVEEQLPNTVIAQKLNLTEKTLSEWKRRNNWEEKRREYLASQYNCYSSLYELLNMVTQKAVRECKETGETPDGATLYFIKAMADKLPKLKALEQNIVFEKQTDTGKEPEELNTDILSSVDKFLRGEQ